MSSTATIHIRDKNIEKTLEPPYSMGKIAELTCLELPIRQRDFMNCCKTYYVNNE